MNAAVVVAAGKGARMGLGHNKVFEPLCGVPVIVRTVRALRETGLFDGGIVVVTGEDDLPRMRALLAGEGVTLCAGGADRQQSVCNGLAACPPQADIIAVHDGARPLVTREVIARTVESALATGSGVAAVPLKDTVKVVDEAGRAVRTPPRETLRAVQTPQTFRAALIRRAHALGKDGPRATDDAALVERLGERVTLTEGDPLNIKLTTPQDLLLAREALRRREGRDEEESRVRIGHGYDVHRLTQGRRLVLCGVEIPYEKGLLGHSDADVALHALCDALLGAAALGDIGRHFPDTDPAYEGADSGMLLDRVAALVAQAGYRVANVDVTIVAQRPKLRDYIETMRERVVAHLGVDISRVSVKATTTEGLGFEGEGLGISAHAVACLERAGA